jgi:DNA-binding transcriptional ArsR family regulator
MRKLIDVAKAMSDESRVRALMALKDKRLCVCQIIELLELAPSTVSKHMSILKNAGLVDSKKSGRWIYYSHSGKQADSTVRNALEWMIVSLEGDESIQQDAKRLVEICKKMTECNE